MDLRKWLLLSDRPKASELELLVMHVPCSDFRSPSVLRLFAAGYRTDFKLTDATGQPTEALRVMASLMEGAQLCTGAQLPADEQRAFGIDAGALAEVLFPTWYLRGLSDRVKPVQRQLSSWQRAWLLDFLPGLDGARIRFRDPDGKRRSRTCYIASCRPNWEMTDHFYEGLWKWNYDHGDWHGWWWRPAKHPDAYRLLGENPAIGAAGGAGAGERAPVPAGAASCAPVPAVV